MEQKHFWDQCTKKVSAHSIERGWVDKMTREVKLQKTQQ